MNRVKIIISLVTLLFLGGCTLQPYKNLAQYNIILNCKKVNIIGNLANNNKTSLQKSNFGFNTNDGRMVYEIDQDGEYQYAQYHSKKSGKVFYKSVSEDIMLAIGTSKYGTYVAMNRSNLHTLFLIAQKNDTKEMQILNLEILQLSQGLVIVKI